MTKNLGIGVYKDAQGTTPIMQAVKKQNNVFLTSKRPKIICQLMVSRNLMPKRKRYYSANSDVVTQGRAKTVQSLGGTGALRIAAEFIKRQTKAQNVDQQPNLAKSPCDF